MFMCSLISIRCTVHLDQISDQFKNQTLYPLKGREAATQDSTNAKLPAFS